MPGLVNENLVTILVRLPGAARAQDLSWYLETGFGPCAREGLVFSDLDAAEVWIRDQIPC